MKKQYPLRIEENVFNKIQRQADEEGISLNAWMNLKLRKVSRRRN